MSNFAESGSVRAIAKLFENINTPMLFTNVNSKPSQIDKIVETNDVVGEEPVQDLNKLSVDDTNNDIFKQNKVSTNEEANIEVTENVVNQSINVPQETEFYKHLKTYPIVNSWVKIFHWVPLPRIVRPRLMELAYSDRFNHYTTSVDSYLDSRLDSLEQVTPFVKTLRMRDIRNVLLDNPIRYVYTTANNSVRGLSTVTQNYLIEPSRNGIRDIREIRGKYITFLGSQPLVRQQLNPMVHAINSRMATYIDDYLPTTINELEIPINYVTINNNSTELSFTVKLLDLAMLRSRPILQERFQRLTKVPANTGKYVASVYKESEENRGEGRIVVIIASLETIRKIATDGYEIISASRFFQFLQSEPTAEEKLSIVEEAGDISIDNELIKETTENVETDVIDEK